MAEFNKGQISINSQTSSHVNSISGEVNSQLELTGTISDRAAIVGNMTNTVLRGKDGVSITHEWDGNNLIITSASGTTTTDLTPHDGITPHIGDDGNWYIGEQDTGVSAIGGEIDWNVIKNKPLILSPIEIDNIVLTTIKASNFMTEDEMLSYGFMKESDMQAMSFEEIDAILKD